jgi:hypothetical protein
MGNDFDAKFLAEGIELTGPVNEDTHRMLLRGFRVREVQPGVLNVQAHFDATDNAAGAELLHRFLGFIGSQPAQGEPQLNAEVGGLEDRDDLDILSGDGT